MTPVARDRVRLGIVGGGLITQVAHLPVLRGLTDAFDVVALAEPSERVRAALMRRFEMRRGHPDHVAMLEAGGLDAVLVCSPSATHATVVLDALRAGVHVLVEKPLCLSPSDADRIVAAASAADLVVQVGYMKRFDPAWERLREELHAAPPVRRIETATIDASMGSRLRPRDFVAATDRADPAVGPARAAAQVADALGIDDAEAHVRPYVDAFLGALIHDVNLVLDVLPNGAQDVRRVVDATGAPDGSAGSALYEIAGDGRWSAAWMLAPGASRFSERLRFYADDGCRSIAFAAPYLDVVATYERELRHFHACVAHGEHCRTPAKQGATDVRLLAASYRASLDREPIAA